MTDIVILTSYMLRFNAESFANENRLDSLNGIYTPLSIGTDRFGSIQRGVTYTI